MMTLQGLNFYSRHFNGDTPGRSPDLFARDTFRHQVSSYFSSANDRCTCPSGNRLRVAEMIDRRMADQNEIDSRQFCRLNRTTWILIEERIDQDVLASLCNQLIGGDAEKSNSGRHREN